jgi:hypothetical protein
MHLALTCTWKFSVKIGYELVPGNDILEIV